ncbi:MAG: hypothetical protein ACE5JU_17905 [Candidatus Binatia bacterium]
MRPCHRSAGSTLGLILLTAAFFISSNRVSAQSSHSPYQLKQNAITALEQISTTDKKLQRTIKQGIRAITRSLSDKGQALFLDEFRIVPPPKGKKVFQRELRAVDQLLKRIKRNDTLADIKNVFQEVIDTLVEADRGIAALSIAAAQQLIPTGIGDANELAKAQREFGEALQETNPRKAIRAFRKAWEFSQEVVENRELVITTFQDNPDPFSPSLTNNALTATFQIRRKGQLHDRKGRSRLLLEFVEIIQDPSKAIVRTLTTRQAISLPRKEFKKRFFDVTVTSLWDGRNEEGELVPGGTYFYLAFGNLIKVRTHGKGRERLEATSFPVSGTILVNNAPPAQLGITVTSPTSGSVINASTILVRGEVDVAAGVELGVTVNGMVAEVSQGEFGTFVPLELGTNTITAKVVDLAGNSASDAVTIHVSDPQEEPLRLLGSPSRGLNPLTVELRFLSLLERPIELFELDFEGDGTADLSSATFDSVFHTYTEEQLFFPTLIVTDDLGNKTSATAIVNVFPLPDLVAKWNDMKDALRIGDIDGALSFIAEESRERYRGIFTTLGTELSRIDSILTDIQLIAVRRDEAEFAMLRISADGVERSFYILFVRDNDGIWRLRTF